MLLQNWPAPEHLPCPGAVLERRGECLRWPGGEFTLEGVQLWPSTVWSDRLTRPVCAERVVAALKALARVIAPADNRLYECDENAPQQDSKAAKCGGADSIPSDEAARGGAIFPRSPLPAEGLAPLLREVLAATAFSRGGEAVGPDSAQSARDSASLASPPPAHSASSPSPLDALLRNEGREALRHVHDWLADALPPPRVAVNMLLGLGPGLTPSGDDVLGGVLLALHASGREPEAQALVTIVGERASATNRISLAHLAAAARGQGAATLLELIAALLDGETRRSRLAALVRGIGRIGHSSGWDAVLGACVVLQAGCCGTAGAPFGSSPAPR